MKKKTKLYIILGFQTLLCITSFFADEPSKTILVVGVVILMAIILNMSSEEQQS